MFINYYKSSALVRLFLAGENTFSSPSNSPLRPEKNLRRTREKKSQSHFTNQMLLPLGRKAKQHSLSVVLALPKSGSGGEMAPLIVSRQNVSW